MKKYNNNKRRSNYPTAVARVDIEMASEVRLFIKLGHSIEEACKAYKITRSQAEYAIKKGREFEDLQKEFIEKEDI